MKLPIYQVDAFSNKLFSGNPAAVCPLETWLPAETMQQIAAENNLAETAFFVKNGEHYDLRWFTPAMEVDLCGHATLATAHILFQHLNYVAKEICFQTRVGELTVKRDGDWYTMNFPTDDIKLVESPPENLLKALNIEPVVIYVGREDYLVIVDSQEVVEQCFPDFKLLASIGGRGVIVSAAGKDVDFVSRGFFPAAGIDEDPVTGSAHTTLVPYWTKQLGKRMMTAQQISQRSGFLKCKYLEERVELSGQAVTYLQGEIYV
ncbi:MAG: PhzF family phenazine biosynthesis protein [Paraglaciecola sp.]|jgi:PhzF family phenazine biosynthesis protein